VANIARVTAILECSNDPNLRKVLRYAQRAWIQLDQQNPPPWEKNTWAKAAASLTVERQAAVLDLSEAITTTTLAGVRPLVGGSSHLQEATRDNLIIGILKKTCARESMKDAMPNP
jgi:carbonic anhydrase